MSAIGSLVPRPRTEIASIGVAAALKSVYAVVQVPEWLFLAALTAMLFRPPDLRAFPLDRIAFVVLVGVTGLRLMLCQERLRLYSASWPMLALTALGLWGVLSQPYDAKAWSVLAAKWIVPVALFHIAGFIFASEESRHKLEWFSVGVLLYLSLMAVCSLLNVKSLIFPRFILDEGIGIHADRARGPFLQAVANGVSLNILGLIALHLWEQRRLRGIVAAFLFLATPAALLASKTRAVWLAAGISIAILILFARGRRSRAVAVAILLLTGAVLGAGLLVQTNRGGLGERVQDRSPVEFRLDMYRAGWQMFTEEPLFGWGNEAGIQPEIAKRITSFHPEYFIFHNTYLELAVERGLVGLALYAWLFASFFSLGKEPDPHNECSNPEFPGRGFGLIWRISLCAYLLNASAVVMNYQFLNGYLFTLAGVLAAQHRPEIAAGGNRAHRLSV